MTLSANAPIAGWADLLSGGNLVRSLALSGGVALHAINLYISTTILPSVIQEIGGREYYAWNTTLFVVASILGAALTTPLLASAGPRPSYGLATGASALAGGLTMLIIFRFIVGLGLGAELPVASTLISEFSPRRIRGRMVVLLEAFWALGWILAADELADHHRQFDGLLIDHQQQSLMDQPRDRPIRLGSEPGVTGSPQAGS